jgi:hypothetical protein
VSVINRTYKCKTGYIGGYCFQIHTQNYFKNFYHRPVNVWLTLIIRSSTLFRIILQSVHLLYKYAMRIIFCFIRTRRIIFQPTNKLSWYPVAMYSGGRRQVWNWYSCNDNVRILCLSCNVKKVGKLVRFKQKGQKQASFLAFHKCCQVCLLRGPRYISTSFILVCALRCT